ncbi:response regulator [Pseudomonas sp.]|uniref:response regulator n=1 Tax=Pseudomonas sp. TaxID=306 RepID=UPI0028AA4E57|nr:response regulator [Pseudomonas sp.]
MHKSVLVVDDEPDILSLLLEHLADCGYDAYGAGTAEQAMSILQAHDDIDLLISDFRLNDGMNGMMVAEAALKKLPLIKVLFISGHPYEVWSTKNFQSLNAQLVSKPFRLEQLDESIHQLVGTAA